MQDTLLPLCSLGSLGEAGRIANRAQEHVPAYRMRVGSESGCLDFSELPVLDKQSYILAHTFTQLLGDDADTSYSVVRSSGSTGKPMYWPQLRAEGLPAACQLQEYLERELQINTRRTLAVVGLALGSWIGGDALSSILKAIALRCSYPFTVFSPGNEHGEIIEILTDAQEHFDQLLLCVCPSAIGHLLTRSEMAGAALPLEKLRFLVLGEPFPEALRRGLDCSLSVPSGETALRSVYGSADTGTLGAESIYSIAARRVFELHPELIAPLDMAGVVPHLFHLAAPDAFVETVNGELCVTRWRAIPLVRYNLHDKTALLSWKQILAVAKQAVAPDGNWAALLAQAPRELPDVIAVCGRADRMLLLCGTNISEPMLDQAVRQGALAPYLTGAYRARVRYEGSRQHLELCLELRGSEPPSDPRKEEIYRGLIEGLSQAQPEFGCDWAQVYRYFDDDPTKRIVRLELVPWPSLSDSTDIKHRGIVL